MEEVKQLTQGTHRQWEIHPFARTVRISAVLSMIIIIIIPGEFLP